MFDDKGRYKTFAWFKSPSNFWAELVSAGPVVLIEPGMLMRDAVYAKVCEGAD